LTRQVSLKGLTRQVSLKGRLPLTALILLLTLATDVFFRSTEGDAAPALPSEPCQVEPRATLSEAEKWVWDRVCRGEIADLNERFDAGVSPIEPESENWKLRSAFLETVLMHDPWRSAIPRQGLRVVGAWFAEELDLQEADIAHPVLLERSRFDADVNLSGTKFASTLSFGNSDVGGVLSLANAKVGGHLGMDKGQFRGAAIDLNGAQIGGRLQLNDANVAGTLDLKGATLDGALL
jgi:uncharacterized protein YjbI with pentapeptide repeats